MIFFESMLYGTPTITFPTDHIKSRLVLGAYKQMEIEHPPVAINIKNYVDLAVIYANREDISALKKTYKTAAKKKLFYTTKAGEEFNKILTNLFNLT